MNFKKIKFYVNWNLDTLFGYVCKLKYCSKWDYTLNKLLDKYYDSAVVDKHTLHLGKTEVWIANKYFSYGGLWSVNNKIVEINNRPSLSTLHRLECLINRLIKKKETIVDSEYEQMLKSLINVEVVK